jgi:predicted Zn-dependent protease
MRGEDGSGWAAAEEENIDLLSVETLVQRALSKAVASKKPETVQPGKYTVVLEPAAVTDFLWYLFFNFGAREADEGRSFLSKGEGENRLGEKLFDKRITVISDPSSSESPALPVGEDGLPQKRTVWIEKGVVRNLNYTRFWAEKMKRPPVSFPPNLIMEGSNRSLDDLIRSTEDGILVSRFWYIRDLNPMILLLTGLTRDGIFRIENGKIVHAIKNFRFNESPVQVFKNIMDLSRPIRAVGGETGMSARIPGLKVKDFTFSSISEAV